jgi:hypothetical protein
VLAGRLIWEPGAPAVSGAGWLASCSVVVAYTLPPLLRVRPLAVLTLMSVSCATQGCVQGGGCQECSRSGDPGFHCPVVSVQPPSQARSPAPAQQQQGLLCRGNNAKPSSTLICAGGARQQHNHLRLFAVRLPHHTTCCKHCQRPTVPTPHTNTFSCLALVCMHAHTGMPSTCGSTC